MFIFLLNMCDARVDIRKQESVSTLVVQQDGQKVENLEHRNADVTQVGSNVTAHEIHRNTTRHETPKWIKMWNRLVKKAGKKNEKNAATKIRAAMGFSEQFPGQPEEGRLDVTNTTNMADRIVGVPFYPHEEPNTDTSHLLCHGGHCEETMGDVTG